jgi:hypothetical protein
MKAELTLIRAGFRFHGTIHPAKVNAYVAKLKAEGKQVAGFKTADGFALYTK